MKIPPQKIIAFIKAHFDFKAKNNGEYLIHNPMQPGKKMHFGINPVTGLCHDWRGDDWVGYNASTGKRNKCTFARFVQNYLNCSFVQAVKAIMGGDVDPRSYIGSQKAATHTPEGQKAVTLPEGSKRLAGDTTKLAEFVRAYLNNQRAITNEMIARYDIHFKGMEVVWPYYEYDELVYWQTRSTIDKVFQFPSDSMYGVSKGMFLYGFDYVEPASYMVIVEAIIGANTIGEQCVASGGAALTPDQLKKIKILGPKDGIILAADLDAPGIKSILANAELLEPLNYRLMYSLPNHVLQQGGKAGELANDWNDIAKDAKDATVARANLEAGIKNQTISNKKALRQLAEKLAKPAISFT